MPQYPVRCERLWQPPWPLSRSVSKTGSGATSVEPHYQAQSLYACEWGR